MERFTISLDTPLAEEFDRLIHARGYQNRSEAMRDILRQHIEQERLRTEQAPRCVAAVSYVYSHHERALAERVINLQHHYHDLTIASMHAHLDHDQCVESLLLKGPTQQVRVCAERLMAERGVRHGALNLIPVDEILYPHVHDAQSGHPHLPPLAHLHTRPKS
ncbi:nickel-responsive transcriptional regulator NikR [Glaciimonas sp. PCH181]|nr:nickel-responsive transcriptional regulator NikR [Glaciimonas sp. PCH181]